MHQYLLSIPEIPVRGRFLWIGSTAREHGGGLPANQETGRRVMTRLSASRLVEKPASQPISIDINKYSGGGFAANQHVASQLA